MGISAKQSFFKNTLFFISLTFAFSMFSSCISYSQDSGDRKDEDYFETLVYPNVDFYYLGKDLSALLYTDVYNLKYDAIKLAYDPQFCELY